MMRPFRQRNLRRRNLLHLACLALLLVGGSRCDGKRHAPTVAQRVITLTPSLTEIVWALGAGSRVVAVSDYCDYPSEAQKRPRVGSFLSPNIERILALKPDLVLLDGVQRDAAGLLEQAGVRVLAVPMQDLEQVRAALLLVGAALGDRQQAAAALRAGLDRELAEVRQQAAQLPTRRALFVVDRQPGGLRGLVVAGPGTYLDELLRLAGGINVFGDLKARYAKIAVEAIEERRPDVILDAVHTEGAQALQLQKDWDELKGVPAVANHRAYVLASPEFVTPGPRLGQVVRRLFSLLHPEAAGALPASSGR